MISVHLDSTYFNVSKRWEQYDGPDDGTITHLSFFENVSAAFLFHADS